MNNPFKMFYVELHEGIDDLGMTYTNRELKNIQFSDVFEAYDYIKYNNKYTLVGDINGYSINQVERMIKLKQL